MAFRTNKMPVLQTKSASGAVATFNTALAMPLASCNISVNAWQEGSGDPSPSNVRPIHGFSEVNATRAGKNLCNSVSENSIYYSDAYAKYTISDNAVIATGVTLMGFIIPVLPNTTYTLSFVRESAVNSEIRARQHSKIPSDWTDGYISQSSGTDKITVTTGATTKALVMAVYATSANRFSNWQCEAGSTATAYEPYVTPTIYTIQLGQEVYGAEVDVVNGVAHCTHGYADLGDFNWVAENDNIFRTSTNTPTGAKSNGSIISSQFAYNANSTGSNRPNYTINLSSYFGPNKISVKDSDYTTATDFKTGVTGVKCVYELATPFDIQLTPTQVETLIGNNTIFADTGDVDLTYKDLDIAKRGNFREVFRLPS